MTDDEILKKLDEESRTGLDLSPGSPICAEAAKLIRLLQSKIENLHCEIADLDCQIEDAYEDGKRSAKEAQ